MGPTITKLPDEKKHELISKFIENLGKRLKAKRMHMGIAQSELARCLDIDQATLSNYEKGYRNMNVSMLPLFSTYCKFPMYELFPKDESQEILNTFSKAVSITVARKIRQERQKERKKVLLQQKEKSGESKVLKAQVYDVGGKEVYEPVTPKTAPKSLHDQYKDAERHTEFGPYTDAEFYAFVKSKDTALYDSILNAGQFLTQLENMPRKDTLKSAIADYIIDELVINQVAKKHSDEESRKAYAYYRSLYYQEMDTALGNEIMRKHQDDKKDYE